MSRHSIQEDASYPLVGQRRFSTASAVMAVLCVLLLIFIKCSFPSLAGVGSEVTNGTVIGSLSTTDGSPAMNTKVWIIPDNYDPVKSGGLPDSLTAMTDEAGDFLLRTPGSGTFNVEGFQQSSGDRVLITKINVTKGDTTYLTIHKVKKPGRIQIVLSPTTDTVNGYVYLPGTICFSRIDSGLATIDSVPAGLIPSVSYSSSSDSMKNHVIENNVTIASDSTTLIVDRTGWNNFRELYLNTTATGATISGNVTNFPVLVRLTANNFDFSQAKSDGSDIRFTKSNGTPLSYEIERWSAAMRTAEIWVKLDTVYGNDSSHGFIMYWGNPNAIAGSNGSAVFDTSDGIQGVWHLNQKCDDISYNRNNGTNYGATDTTGIIGYCKKFDGSDSIKITGLLGSPASITMSAWAELDSVPGGNGAEILSIGDAVLIRMDFPVLSEGTMGAIHPYGDTVYSNVTTGRFLRQTGWHLISFTADPNTNSQTLYIDGSAVRSEKYTISIDYSRVGQNTFIGTHGNGTAGYNFSGRIDEVRVYRKAISADYLKLCFMNQKDLDALVKWQKAGIRNHP
jgi:hypothetical protein